MLLPKDRSLLKDWHFSCSASIKKRQVPDQETITWIKGFKWGWVTQDLSELLFRRLSL